MNLKEVRHQLRVMEQEALLSSEPSPDPNRIIYQKLVPKA